MAKCVECIHQEVCEILRDRKTTYQPENIRCDLFKPCSQFIELPCIAMIEQFLNNGKFDKRRTNHNGRMAVIYFDKKKFPAPLIDVTTHYNSSEANKRIEELKSIQAEQDLKDSGKNG